MQKSDAVSSAGGGSYFLWQRAGRYSSERRRGRSLAIIQAAWASSGDAKEEREKERKNEPSAGYQPARCKVQVSGSPASAVV